MIRVGLVQINSSFSGQHYLPLSAGMLQAYAQKHLQRPDQFEFAMPLFQFMRVEEASERLTDCDIVGFSSYVWNEQHTLAIARDYKRRNPNGIVVFGGPQVPNSRKQFRQVRTAELTVQEQQRERMLFTPSFHHEHPYIDMACHGEGERVFTAILERMAADGCRDKRGLPSVSYVDGHIGFHFNPELPRMNDAQLAQTPSPLTTGVFDALMAAHPDQKWILMYETDRGCPYSCTYCDWGGATEDRISQFPMAQIQADITWLGERMPYVFLCNANFGILKRDVDIAESFADTKARFGRLEGVSTQNAKNPKKHTLQALRVLEKAGLNKAAVMSQQSLNPATLEAVRRNNMKLDEYYQIQKELAAEGIYTMTDLILPMPEETRDTILDAISTLITQGQHSKIQFNNLSILRNTEMGDPEYQRRYGMQIVKAPIINGHGQQDDIGSGILEWQELVVGTHTMPPDEWRKTRALCWLINVVYFNKLLQIPSIILHKVYGIPYRDIFTRCSEATTPVLGAINALFLKTAGDIQQGRAEFIHSREWLDVWWPPEEYALIKLCIEGKLPAFYQEAGLLLEAMVPPHLSRTMLRDALTLNKALIKLPFQTLDCTLDLNSNVWEIYRATLVGKHVEPAHGPHRCDIDRTTEHWHNWSEWCQMMVWYGNRRGAYLYGRPRVGTEIPGHH